MVAVAHPLVTSPAPRLRLVPAPTRPPSPADRGPSAVYRRRRLVALVVAASLVVALAVAGRALAAAVRLPPAPASSHTAPVVSGPAPLPGGEVYVVQPGDTLWSIAGRVAPGTDRRGVVDRLAAQRGEGPLRPGERILLP